MKAESPKLYFSSAFGFLPIFFLIFDGKKTGAGKLAESQEHKAESPRISGVKS